MNVIYFIAFIASVSIHCTDGQRHRTTNTWRDCTKPESPVKITNMDIQPFPVQFPGTMFFTMVGYSNRTLGSSKLELDIKRLGWVNIPIPCMFNIGSCTYDDLCTMLSQMIREDWVGITREVGQNIRQMVLNNGINPDLCPQPPQAIHIVNNPLTLPRIPTILSWFASGVYRVNVKVTSNAPVPEELVCMTLTLNIERKKATNCGWYNPFC